MPWRTAEEWAELNAKGVNFLYLLAHAGQIPHRWMLGRLYVHDESMQRWLRKTDSDLPEGQ